MRNARKLLLMSLSLSAWTAFALGGKCAIVNYSLDSIIIHSIKGGRQYFEAEVEFEKLPDEGVLFQARATSFMGLSKCELEIEDGNGKLRKFGKKDLQRVAIGHSYSLYEDQQMFFFEEQSWPAPLRVHLRLEKELEGTLFLPSWVPYLGLSCPVSLARTVYVYPAEFELRHVIRTQLPVSVEERPGKLRLEARNIPQEGLMEKDSKNLRPYLLASFQLQDFQFGGIEGSSRTWSDLGRWQWQLMEGQDSLTDQMLQFIEGIRLKHPDKREFAAAIYEHLQSSKRYVSIQEGIGGWRPNSAKEVETKAYGDCKGLANYACTMLNGAGIDAYCALIRAGEGEDRGFDEAFPSMQFNHMILCIPSGRDTTWLECTNGHIPFGYLGPFTENRPALLITSDGGKLVRTPMAPVSENYCFRNVRYVIEDSEHPSVLEEVQFIGNRIEFLLALFGENEEAQTKALAKHYRIGEDQILEFHWGLESLGKIEARHSAQIGIGKGFKSTNKRIYLSLLTCPSPQAEIESLRSSLTHYRASPLLDIDSFKVSIPSFFEVEYLPQDLQFENRFGRFERSSIVEDGHIFIKREFMLGRMVLDAHDVSDLLSFLEQVSIADKQQIVLRKME